MAVPPGGALFELMSGDECIQTLPTLTDVDKPPSLSMLDDSKWRSWHAELSEVVAQYWNMAIPIAVPIFGFLVVVAVAVLQFAEVVTPPIWLLPALIVPFVLISFLLHCIIVGKNEELDKQIRELCAKLSSSTEGAVKVRVGNKLQHLSSGENPCWLMIVGASAIVLLSYTRAGIIIIQTV